MSNTAEILETNGLHVNNTAEILETNGPNGQDVTRYK